MANPPGSRAAEAEVKAAHRAEEALAAVVLAAGAGVKAVKAAAEAPVAVVEAGEAVKRPNKLST